MNTNANLHFEEEEAEPEEVEPIFEKLKIAEGYEISNNVYPFIIRRIDNKKVVSSYKERDGYMRINLNRVKFQVHRVIATQFILNPENLPEIDHINKLRDDNRLCNLRWVSHSTNQQNKASHNGVKINYVEELSNEAVEVSEYGNHKFEFYYFDNNKFYNYNGVAYRELCYLKDKDGYLFVCVRNVEGKQTKIYLTKFKKLYNMI